MRIKVLWAAADNTTHTDEFTCTWGTRQIFADGRASIIMKDGRDEAGQKVVAALYRTAMAVLTYED